MKIENMGLFSKKKLIQNDSVLGEIKSFHRKGTLVHWEAQRVFFNETIALHLKGTSEGVLADQKQIILGILNQESLIRLASEKALKELFIESDMNYESLDDHFILKSISLSDSGFELNLEETNTPYCSFNIHFEDNQVVDISIDS